MLEIDHLGDTGLGLQQLFRVRRGRREKGDGAARLGRGDRAHIRQVPDDVADALLHLNDGGRGHGAAFLQTTRLVPRMCRSPSLPLGLEFLERARHALPHAVVMPEHDAVRSGQRPCGFAIGDDIVVGMRTIDEDEPGAAMMSREVERRRIPVSLRDAPRIGRPFGLRLGEVAPRPGLVDESALARREREFRCRLGGKIECENRKMGGGVDGEIQRRAAIEGADLDDFLAARDGRSSRRQHGKLGEIDVTLIALGMRQPDRLVCEHVAPAAKPAAASAVRASRRAGAAPSFGRQDWQSWPADRRSARRAR